MIVVGIMGMALVLAAFLLNEFVKSWHQETLRYNLLNVVGAALLVQYAFTLHSWPFLILNAVWAGAAGLKIARLLYS